MVVARQTQAGVLAAIPMEIPYCSCRLRGGACLLPVTTMDRTHHRYIIRAMEAGCDCITEKPMTGAPHPPYPTKNPPKASPARTHTHTPPFASLLRV